MRPQTEPSKYSEAIQSHGKSPAISEVVQRVTAATVEWRSDWSQADEWTKRYGKKVNAVASTENFSLIDRLKEATGEDFDEVSTFFSRYLSSRSLERQARYVKGFCGGAHFILDKAKLGDLSGRRSSNEHEPIAWVSDRNWYPNDSENPQMSRESHGRVLNNNELWAALQKKRFSENGHEDKIGPPRRIYINNPDGVSILALLRTTPPSQVPGFQELLANYITDAPTPAMSLREISWWGSMCFVFSSNLPFFAVSTQGEQDVRTLHYGKRPLRRRHDLYFLHSGENEAGYHDQDVLPQSQAFLHEAVCSIVVTGRSERYWTAACLNDDFFDDEDEPRLSPDEDVQYVDGETDPITFKMDNKTGSPRAYALAALATTLTKIVDYHKDIQARFGTSLNHHTSTSWHDFPEISPDKMQDWRKRYPEVLDLVIYYNVRIIEKLEHFLSRHLIISPEGLPQHPLWQSVQNEERVSQSLTEIRDSLGNLRDIDSELRRFSRTCTEARRERKIHSQDEEVRKMRKTQKITMVASVLGILNLIVQVYASDPGNINVLLLLGLMVCHGIVLLSVFHP